MSVNSVMHGSKLFTLRPNLHEQLDELMVMELTLPEDIERMKTAKRRDKEQVGPCWAGIYISDAAGGKLEMCSCCADHHDVADRTCAVGRNRIAASVSNTPAAADIRPSMS
jgi:hypothetical protein